MGRAKPDVRPPVAAIPSAKSIPLVAMAVGLSAAVIGWQHGAATNVTRCRPITTAQYRRTAIAAGGIWTI